MRQLVIFIVVFLSSFLVTIEMEAQVVAGGDVLEAAPIVHYIPPETNAPIRRREGGLVKETENSDAVGGTSRGVSRGVARGVSRGVARGVSRGVARGVSRGVARGVSRGVARGVSRGVARGVSRGVARGVDQSQEDMATLPIPDILAPLAPRHVGWTLKEQPSLFWYISAPWDGSVEFVLNEVGMIEPILEIQLTPESSGGVFTQGMHKFDLAKQGIHLAIGKEYEWFITIVLDPNARSGDVLGSGVIRRVEEKDLPLRHVAERGGDRLYTVLAEKGLWYDAVDELFATWATQPNKRDILRRDRAILMEQVEMPKVAIFDKKDI